MILSRVKISPQQRYDLEDYTAQQAAVRSDAKLWTKASLADINLVLAGFSVSGVGLNSATVAMTGATLMIPQNDFDFSYFVAAPAEPDVTIPDADLVDGVRNYLEAELVTQDGVPLTKAFWDPEANSGNGAEFNQIVNTITDLRVNFVVSTGGFSGDVNRVPIAIIDTDGTGVIKIILDRREMFGRLGKPNDIDNDYTWGTKQEPTYALNMTGVAGTFVAGETITIGGETATVTTGGTTSIVFNVPTGINFSNGDSVTGGTSGATGTVNTVSESFAGVDKSLKNQKQINDALMSELKTMKGTRFWWQNQSGSIVGTQSVINSLMAPLTSGAKVSWNGSVLSITDSSGAPASTDNIAAIRMWGNSGTLNLRRQDGTGGSATLAIADGQVLYVELPATGVSRNYTGGIGVGSTNYKVVARASFVGSDTNYWLAYREGSKLFFRGNGELQANESAEIGDNVPQTLLTNLGLVDEVTAATYSSDIRGVANQSLVARIGVNTDAIGDEQEDRSAYLRSDDPVLWTGSQLIFTADIILEIVNTKSGTLTAHTILAANSPISLNNNESVYVSISRTTASENVSPVRTSITPIPAQTQANKDIIILARRKDVSAVGYLHLPFMKSLMGPGQSVRLGQSGSSGGIQKVMFHNPISTTLPSGPTVTIDGIAGVNDDLVLFSNLSSGNNEVYKLGGVGVSITWTAQNFFNGSLTPSGGDFVVATKGLAFANQVGEFDGTNWKFNDVVRHFSGADFWEQSSLKTSTLTDNTTGNIFSVSASGSENFVIDYSVVRNSIKETGTVWITHDGTNAFFTAGSAYSGATGLSFLADISAGNVRFRYTLTSTGFNATIKYSVKRWSDAAGGPTGLPSYTGGGGSTPAGGSDGNIQYNSLGTLAGNNNFNIDPVDGSINLNGMRQTILSSGITILDNQAAPANLFTYAKSFTGAIIEYSIVRNGAYRTGRFMVANDGSVTSSNGDSVETAATGITLSAVISGANVQIQYTSTNTGFNATFKYSMRKWS